MVLLPNYAAIQQLFAEAVFSPSSAAGKRRAGGSGINAGGDKSKNRTRKI
jgi:hypothetical protein